MKKIINYLPFVVLLLLPLLFYPGVDTSGWRSGSDVHAFLEFAASLLAITAGIMVLLHFFSTGRWFFLIISIGFVLIGTEEFVHAIFSFNRLWSEIPPTFKLAISTTWLAGRFVLLASFFIAFLFGKREIVPAKRGLYAVVYNIIGLIFAAFVTLLIFNSQHVPDFVQLGSITKKFFELSFALLFFVAFLFYSNIYFKQQSHSSLLWGILACIIFQVLVHIFVFDSQAFYDSHWDAAHLLVFLSYFPPIFGVWGETIKIHKSSQLQVIELEKEMAERKKAEEALRRSEELFRIIASSTPDHLLVQDSDLRYSFVMNPQLGLTEKDMIGKTDHDFLSKEDADKLTEIKSQVLKTGSAVKMEMPLISSTGEQHFFDGSYVPKFDAKGQVDGLIGYFRNVTDRKQAKEELWESEKRYRAVVEDQTELICRFLPDGTLTFVNDAYCRYFGKEKTALVGNSFLPLILEEDQPAIVRMQALTSKENPIVTHEHRVILPDGQVRWQQWINRVIYDEQNHLLEYQAVGRDITDRKQAEEALRKSESRYRLFIENSRDVIMTRNLEGKFTYVSPTSFQLTGYKADEIMQLRLEDMITPGSLPIAIDTLNKLIEKGKQGIIGQPMIVELEQFCKDGSTIWTDVSVELVKDEVNDTVIILGVTRNITERKQAEEALCQSEANFHRSLEDSPLGVRIVTPKGETIYANRAILDIYDYDIFEELKITPVEDRYTPESYAEHQIRKEKRKRGDDDPSEYDISIVRKDGEVRHLQVFRKEVLWDGEKQCQVLYNDITARKQAEEKIQASLREKDILLNEIHHRVKNNLQVISSLLKLQAYANKNPELIERFQESQNRIRAMAMVHEKLYSSKDFSRINLTNYVRDLSQELFLSHNVNPGKIDLTIQTDGDVYLDVIRAIPCGLVLNELISNALKHAFPGDEPGKLQITIGETKDTEIEIVVRDNGLGLPDDVDIHEPRSLGLDLVNGLVTKQLDGQIEVRRDKGTAFRITFPL